MMNVDLRKHPGIREQVLAGIAALRVQGRQVWDGVPLGTTRDEIAGSMRVFASDLQLAVDEERIKLVLGNALLCAVMWIADFGFDPIECLATAIEEQSVVAGVYRERDAREERLRTG